ncbi:MAG: hypothetical protein QOF24_2852 [Verrucomicrobiota bacterium]|jgi:hypothetical protein
MQHRQKFFIIIVTACAVAIAFHAQATTPPPKPRPTQTPLRDPDLKAPNKLPPQLLVTDLLIEKATQTSSDSWIVRIRNAGNADAGTSSLQVTYITAPSKGGFPGGEFSQGSISTPAVKAGTVLDINVKTPQKTAPDMKARFALNADHKIKETNYANNTIILPANPSYK